MPDSESPHQQVYTYVVRNAGRAGAAWQTVSRQPGWVSRIAGVTFLLVIAVPILLLFFVALLAAAIVFAVLLGVHALGNVFRGVLPRRDGRENVRVIRKR